MFGSPLSPASIKAETAYRMERTKREFRSTPRGERPVRAGRIRRRRARRALGPTAAA